MTGLRIWQIKLARRGIHLWRHDCGCQRLILGTRIYCYTHTVEMLDLR